MRHTQELAPGRADVTSNPMEAGLPVAHVVALTAVCDLFTSSEYAASLRSQRMTEAEVAEALVQFDQGLSWSVLEAAHLSDGREILLRDGLGWSVSAHGLTREELWKQFTVKSLKQDVLNVVLPDDAEETGQEHPYELFARSLRSHGVAVRAEDLRLVAYSVVLAPRLQEKLAR